MTHYSPTKGQAMAPRRRRKSIAGRIGRVLLAAVLVYVPLDLVFRNDRCHFHPYWGLEKPFAKKPPLRVAVPFEDLAKGFQAPAAPAALRSFLRTHAHQNVLSLPHAPGLDTARVRKIGFRNQTFWAGRFVDIKDSYVMASGERVEFTIPPAAGWLDFSSWAVDSLDSHYRILLSRKKGDAWALLWQSEGYTPESKWFPFRAALDPEASHYALEFHSDRPDGILCIGNPHVLQADTAARRANVVIVVVDGLRRDAITAAAGQRFCPQINKIARQSTVFANARSASHWTRPAVAALMTSKLPRETGLSVTRFGLDSLEKARFHRDMTTLPHFLRQNGYVTAGFTNDAFLLDFYSIGADIGLNECYDNQEYVLMDAKMTNRAVRWMNLHRDEPFMVYVHLDGPHGQRVPPSRYLLRSLFSTGVSPSSDLLYWSGVRYSDRYVGEIWKALGQMGLQDNTVLVVLSDHGSSRRLDSQQGSTLHDDEIRIPLVWRSPRIAQRREIWDPVSIVDIMPSLCRELDLPMPAGLRGTDIVSAPVPQRVIFFQGRNSQGLVDGNWKYYRLAQQDFLFDLSRDPGESNNLVAHRSDALRRAKLLLADSLGGRCVMRLRGSGRSAQVSVSPRANLDSAIVDGRAFGFDSLSTAPFLFPAKWSEARLILRTGFFRCRIRSLGAPLFVGPYAVRCSGDSLALAGREDFQRVLSTDAKRYPVESGVALWGEYEHFDEPPPEGPQSFHGEVRTILEDWGYIQKGTGDQ